jgi:hypothetical protein
MFLQHIEQRARQALPLPAGILVLVLAACGLASPVSTKSQSNRPAPPSFSAMNSCLQKAGYKLVGIPADESSANVKIQTNNAADQQLLKDPDYKKAFDRCATSTGFNKTITSVGNRQPTAKDIQKANQEALKLYTCMRQKGWTLADPTKDSRGMLSPPMPPSSLQGARMSQFGNDMNSCIKKSGANGVVTIGSGGSGANGGGISGNSGGPG